MFVIPTASDVANPLLPSLFPIVAINVSDELQVTCEVMSRIVASLKVPIAENWALVPDGTDGVSGLISMEMRLFRTTVRVVLPLIVPNAAVIFVVPAV